MNRTEELITQVIDPKHPKHLASRTLNVPVDPRLPAFVHCDVPLAQHDTERLREVKEKLEWFVETKFPFASFFLSRANGLPYVNQFPASYLVQATCFSAVHPGVFTVSETVESVAKPRTFLEAGRTSDHEEAAEEEAAEQPLVPFTVGQTQTEYNGNRTGRTNSHSTEAQPTKQKKPQGQVHRSSDATTQKKRGRPRKQPVERS